MSHHRLKTTYEEMSGFYGATEVKTVYADTNNSCDIVSIYDENGDFLMAYEDCEKNNLLFAINRLDYGFDGKGGLNEGIEYWTQEDYQMIEAKQNKPYVKMYTQEQMSELEARNNELEEAFNISIKLAKSMKECFEFYKGQFSVQSQSWMADKVNEILEAEQALNKK